MIGDLEENEGEIEEGGGLEMTEMSVEVSPSTTFHWQMPKTMLVWWGWMVMM